MEPKSFFGAYLTQPVGLGWHETGLQPSRPTAGQPTLFLGVNQTCVVQQGRSPGYPRTYEILVVFRVLSPVGAIQWKLNRPGRASIFSRATLIQPVGLGSHGFGLSALKTETFSLIPRIWLTGCARKKDSLRVGKLSLGSYPVEHRRGTACLAQIRCLAELTCLLTTG